VWLGSYQIRRHTLCGRAKGKMGSVCSCATIQKDHVPSVGGRWAIQSQWVVVQISRTITYKLQDGVSAWLGSY
jgi:hypothetical protein